MRRGIPHPPQPNTRPPGSCFNLKSLRRSWSARPRRNCRAMRRSFSRARVRATQRRNGRAAAGAIVRDSHQGRVPRLGHLSRSSPLIPLIPLNPAESRLEFESYPRWDEEPDRGRGDNCGLPPCSRSFYPCARRPRHVMPGLVPGIRPSMCLPSVRRAWLLEMPGTSPGMTACGGGRSERPRTGPTTCKRAWGTGC